MVEVKKGVDFHARKKKQRSFLVNPFCDLRANFMCVTAKQVKHQSNKKGRAAQFILSKIIPLWHQNENREKIRRQARKRVQLFSKVKGVQNKCNIAVWKFLSVLKVGFDLLSNKFGFETM